MTNEELLSVVNTFNNASLLTWKLRKDYLKGRINTDEFIECIKINQILIISNALILANNGIYKK